MKKLILLLTVFLTGYLTVNAQTNDRIQVENESDESRMKTLIVAIYETGDNIDFPEEEIERITGEHKRYIKELMEGGMVIMSGLTFEDETAMKAMVFFNSEDIDAVKKSLLQDPAVEIGYYKIELHKWSTQPGVCIPEK